MKKIFFLSLLFMTIAATVFCQPKHTFEIKGGNFLYDGKPIQIHSGEMHFARIPKAYWRQRLKMMKAMGLNTVATYVFWNYHETSPGVWDFKSESRDIAEFIKLAGDEGLVRDFQALDRIKDGLLLYRDLRTDSLGSAVFS